MAFDHCDLIRRALRCEGGRRVTRHKDQKSFRAGPNANSSSKTSKKEGYAHSIARNFAETKESFSDSVSEK
jgi:hypothetical protein